MDEDESPTAGVLRDKMTQVAIKLLDATYEPILNLKEGDKVDTLPKADVFNAVVNWIRTEAGLDPVAPGKSGLAKLRDRATSR